MCASALRCFHCMGWRLLVIYLFIYFFGFPSFIFFIFRPCLDPRGWLSVSKASRSITWSAQLLLQLLILQLMLMSRRHARRRLVFFFFLSFLSSVRARVCACVTLRDVHSRTRYRDILALIKAGSAAACFSTGLRGQLLTN